MVESTSRDNYMIGIDLTVLLTGTEIWWLTIINLYSLGGELKTEIKVSYCISKNNNTILIGDFNIHYQLQYGSRLIDKAYIFPAYTIEVNKLVENLTTKGFQILNCPGRSIHFSHNGTTPSILNLAFAQGPINSHTQLTYKDKLESDHCYLKISTIFNMIYTPLSFRFWKKITWKIINTVFNQNLPSSDEPKTNQEVYEYAIWLLNKIKAVCNSAIPVDKLGWKQYRAWQTPEYT